MSSVIVLFKVYVLLIRLYYVKALSFKFVFNEMEDNIHEIVWDFMKCCHNCTPCDFYAIIYANWTFKGSDILEVMVTSECIFRQLTVFVLGLLFFAIFQFLRINHIVVAFLVPFPSTSYKCKSMELYLLRCDFQSIHDKSVLIQQILSF